MNIIISEIIRSSLAEKYGLRAKDEIKKIDNIQPTNLKHALELIKNKDKSTPLKINISRKGELLEFIINFENSEGKIGVNLQEDVYDATKLKPSIFIAIVIGVSIVIILIFQPRKTTSLITNISYQGLETEYNTLISDFNRDKNATWLQKEEREKQWRRKYIGKFVQWEGWVNQVMKTLFSYQVSIDLDPPRSHPFPMSEIELVLRASEKSKAMSLERNQFIKFQGRIKEIRTGILKTRVYLRDVILVQNNKVKQSVKKSKVIKENSESKSVEAKPHSQRIEEYVVDKEKALQYFEKVANVTNGYANLLNQATELANRFLDKTISEQELIVESEILREKSSGFYGEADLALLPDAGYIELDNLFQGYVALADNVLIFFQRFAKSKDQGDCYMVLENIRQANGKALEMKAEFERLGLAKPQFDGRKPVEITILEPKSEPVIIDEDIIQPARIETEYSRKESRDNVIKFEDAHFEGLVYGDKGQIYGAKIDGVIYHKGENIKGYRIEEMQPDNLILSKDGSEYILEIDFSAISNRRAVGPKGKAEIFDERLWEDPYKDEDLVLEDTARELGVSEEQLKQDYIDYIDKKFSK